MCLSMFVIIGVRTEFSKLGEFRSLIAYHVKLMALTAVATTTTKRSISSILGIREPSVISASPDKANVCYGVKGVSFISQN